MCGSRMLCLYKLRSDLSLLRTLNSTCRTNYSCIFRYFSTKSQSELRDEIESASYFDELKNSFKEKVMYHSFYKYESFVLQKQKEHIRNELRNKKVCKVNVVPVSLKYILEDDNERSSDEGCEEVKLEKDDAKVVLPYEVSKVNLPVTDEESSDKHSDEDEQVQDDKLFGNASVDELIVDRNMYKAKSGKWMSDYDYYEEVEEEDESDHMVDGSNLRKKYGTPDRSIPMSNVPCGGCGALLHCQDPGIPGYLPSEIYSSCNYGELRSITCQRCHFMKNYDTALSVSVDPKSYPKLLSRLRHEKALVILLVDITDFPCSIWPGIIDIIGRRRPLFVVGNKVDLLIGDRKGWIRRVTESLKDALPKTANIVHTTLISAKTGFGVEELINKLNNVWQYRGDVYLVGCTNVGKSTLFNALLASDYCKVQASDLLQRATTAPWPGTTMNLLKFPILRPSGVRLFLRTQRLQEDRMVRAAERHLWEIQIAKKKSVEPVQLVGHIGRSFSKGTVRDDKPDPFRSRRGVSTKNLPGSGFNPHDPAYKNSRWLYDTPGVVHPDQIIDLLTTEELMKTLPKTPIIHRVFIFKKDWTLFIAGLGRIDLIELSECKDGIIKIIVFRPDTLPVIICETNVADDLYKEFVGTPMFAVPSGGPDRLKVWPALKPCDDIVLQGKSYDESCSDIVLSNAGWVSIAPGPGVICKFRSWTPDARGIHVRKIPLMRYAVTVHGSRIHKTPAYSCRYLKEASIETKI